MDVQLETGTPVIFGVLTCMTERQALVRAVPCRSQACCCWHWALNLCMMDGAVAGWSGQWRS